jgi:hypothetical protein
MNRIWKALLVMCCVAAALSGVIVLGLQESFIHGPKIAQPETGQVVPFSNHGEIHYVTQERYRIFDVARIVGQIAGWSAIFLAVVMGKAGWKSRSK